MSLSTNLPYADDNNGRIYASGSYEKVQTGAYVDIESGGQWRVGGTAVTLNASEFNELDGMVSGWAALLPGAPTIASPGAQAGNDINKLAVNVTGNVNVRDGGPLSLDTVGGTSQVSVGANVAA